MKPDRSWRLIGLGATPATRVAAVLIIAAAGVLAAILFFSETDAPPEVAARASEPVEAQPVPAEDTVAMDLAAVLERAGIEQRLLLFFESETDRIYGIDVHGAEAVAAWELMRAYTNETGYYPVILGEGTTVRLHRPLMRELGDPRDTLERARIFDFDSWQDSRVNEFGAAPRGTYEAGSQEAPHLVATTDPLRGLPFDHVAIALVPTRSPWEVPAFLAFGDWNDCPPPEVHVAVMKRWHELYGAEVVSVTRDIIEMQVGRPPFDEASSLEAAAEQYAYCAGVVSEGAGDLDALAGGIEGASFWFFSWN